MAIKTKINKKVRSWLGIILVVLIGCAGLLIAIQYNAKIAISKADNSASFSSGQVSIDKKYYTGNGEVDSLSVNTGSSVTVRLKYNNTGSASATNVAISDTIPSGFTLVSSSLKNCYSDLSCVDLNDNLFASGTLNVAPGAGYFGYPVDNTVNNSNLEIGRKKYFKIVTCQDSNNQGDWYSPFSNDGFGGSLGLSNVATDLTLSQIQSAQAGYCTAAGSNFLSTTFLARGNRYFHQVSCQASTDIPYFGDWKIPSNTNFQAQSLGVNNNSTALQLSDLTLQTPDYCTQPGRTFDTQVLDILGKRYLHQIKCNDPIYFGDMYIPTVSNGAGGILGFSNNATALSLTQIRNGNASFCNAAGQTFESNVQDSLDTTKGSGYIEYRITAPTTGGIFGTNVSMSGSFSPSPLVDTAGYTISVGSNLSCPYLLPANGVRNIALGDAELRTDQDFTCNYIAKICFTIFQDTNANGIQDSNETLVGGVNVKLYSQDGLTEIYSMLSSASGEQCFEPLLNSKIYKIKVINPPSPYSTTGTDEQEVGVTYQTGSKNILFGYTSGSISLSAEQNVTLGNVLISPNPQQVCTIIHNIQIVDTRQDKPGWSVTATVNDFVDTTNPSNKILSAGRVQLAPQTMTVVSGSETGISPGQTKIVSSISDPVAVFSASTSNGLGTYKTDMQLCLTIPPFSRLGQYSSTVNFVV